MSRRGYLSSTLLASRAMVRPPHRTGDLHKTQIPYKLYRQLLATILLPQQSVNMQTYLMKK